MDTDTIKLIIEMPAKLERKWLGEGFSFAPDKMSQTMRFRIFEYGLRVFNDTYPKLGELQSEKIELLRGAVADANAGKEWVGRSRGGVATLSNAERLTLTITKEELKRRFVVVTGMSKIVDMCEASPQVAAYFNGTVWIDGKVHEWCASEQGKTFDAKGKADKKIKDMKALKEQVDTSDDVVLF